MHPMPFWLKILGENFSFDPPTRAMWATSAACKVKRKRAAGVVGARASVESCNSGGPLAAVGGTCLWYSQVAGICPKQGFPPLGLESAVSHVTQAFRLRQRFFPLEAGLGLPPSQARGPNARMSQGMLV